MVALIFSVTLGVYYIYFQINEYDRNGVRVGVVDSGCSSTQSNIVRADSFVNYTYGYKLNSPYPFDVLNHGSKVCGKILEQAPDALLYSARIAGDTGEITYDGLLAAIDWLAEDMEVDIINLSLGAFFYLSSEFEMALREYTDQGIIIVTASGNDGGASSLANRGIIQWPGVMPWTVTVGAEEENGTVSDFSSVGSSIYQMNVVEFAASGVSGGARGTSFSAPTITGILAYTMAFGRALGYDLNSQQLQAILALSNSNQYSAEVGWGLPDIEKITDSFDTLLSAANTSVLIEASNGIDPSIRFPGENVSYRFKVIHQTELTSALRLGGDVIDPTWKIIQSGNWGSIVEVRFTVPQNVSSATVTISGTTRVEISMNVTDRPFNRVLMDNSLSASGYNFPRGELRFLDSVFRENGIVADYEHFGMANLTEYQLVILLDAGQFVFTDSGKTFTRTDDQSVYTPYLDYLRAGGNIFVFGNSSDKSKDTLNPLMNELGIKLTNEVEGQPNLFVSSSNFTTDSEYQDLFDGVSQLYYKGMGMTSTNENSTELVWYSEVVDKGPISELVDHALAIGGTYGSGNFIVFNNLDAYRNSQIGGKEGNVKFLLNSLIWLFSKTSQSNL